MVSIEEVSESKPDPALVQEKEKSEPSMEENDGFEKLMGDDLQMKVLEIDDGSSGEACDVGSVVVVDFVGHFLGSDDNKDDTSGPIFHEANNWMVVVGDKDVTPALEMGIRFLKEGQHAIIYSHSKYAYGPMGRQNGDYELPPNSSVVYELHVKAIKDGATPIEIATSKKQMGNDCYQNEWSNGYGKNKALMLYKRAADSMTNLVARDPEDEEARAILLDCLNNITAVHMRAKEYGKAKEAATQVLLHDPDNVKALLRAAKAAMLDPSSSYEESDAAIEAAEQVVPDDAEVKKLRAELGRRKREYKKKAKAMSKAMAEGIKAKGGERTDLSESGLEKGGGPDASGETPPAKETVEKTLWQLYGPYLIQLLLPFITYGFFLLLQKYALVDVDGQMKSMVKLAKNDVESESDEFS